MRLEKQLRRLYFFQSTRLATEVGQSTCSFLMNEDVPLAQISPLNVTALFGIDAQHSILGLHRRRGETDFMVYSPYGQCPGNANSNSILGFNGEHIDPLTNHYLLGNGYRGFNPPLMRFNKPDSASPFDEGGLNAYAYCLGDPINRRDPSGHNSWLMPRRIFGLPLIRAAVADRKALLPTSTGKAYARDALEAFATTAFPAQANTHTRPTPSPLNTYVSNMENPAPFAAKVHAVVRNKNSHNKPPINETLQRAYISNVEAANTGDISSTTAHLNMIGPWRRHGGPASFVATKLHPVSALASGVEDQAQYKTGKYLRR